MANRMQVIFNDKAIATIEVEDEDIDVLLKGIRDRDSVKLSNNNIIDCEYVRAVIHVNKNAPAVY